MDNKVLKIKYKDCLQCILLISLLQGAVSSYIGFSKIGYVCDFLLAAMLMAKVVSKDSIRVKKCYNIEYFPVLMFAVIVIIGWIFHPAPLLMALWAVRNYGRFFLYFYFCSNNLDSDDVDDMENIFIKIFPLHVVLIAWQYIVEGMNQDQLNGIFGTGVGGNAGLIIYLCIVLCIVITRYEYKRLSLSRLIVYLMLILLNAALSELKFMFIVAFGLLGWYLLLSKHKVQGMLLAFAFMIIMYIAIQIFYAVFPGYADFMSLDSLLNQISTQKVYSSQNDVGRSAVFSKLTPIITQWAGKNAVWIGIGLGNADYSSAASILNSAFFQVYEDIHYTWLSLGYLFVETGYLGTIAYTMFFVALEVCAILKYQRKASYGNMLETFFPLLCMIILVYNAALRSNYAYPMFAALSWNIARLHGNNVRIQIT